MPELDDEKVLFTRSKGQFLLLAWVVKGHGYRVAKVTSEETEWHWLLALAFRAGVAKTAGRKKEKS